MEKLLCIIPARGGSKRIPHKNIALFKGRPIISYPINTVKESNLTDEIIVSTDSPEIASVAESFGAKVPFLRSADTANDHAGVADVLIEVIEEYKKRGREFEYVLCVFATNPLMKCENLVSAFKQLQENPVAESISTFESYSYPPQRGLIIEGGEMKMAHPEFYECRSQDLPKMYHDSCQFYFFRTYALLRDRKMYTQHTLPFILSSAESQDIDTQEDWLLTEMKYDFINKPRITS